MTADSQLIDRIVSNVLQQLQPKVAARTELPPVVTIAANKLATTAEIELLQPVITADVLQERVKTGQAVRIGAKSLLTPSARDWLRTRQILWNRADQRSSAATTGSSRRQLLVSSVTPSVTSLREAAKRELSGWKHELLGRPSELVESSARAINTAEAEMVVAFTDVADAVACRCNRHQRVRAAVVSHADQLKAVSKTLGANVLAINPLGRSFIELRNLLRACAALPCPKPPAGWE